VQIWPSTPVAKPLIEDNRVVGIRVADQGVDKLGNPDAGFMAGMDIRAALTVIGDGPVGPVGREIDSQFGTPKGFERYEWAVGMKFVIDLPETTRLEPGTVLHTFGYPEPEIFGFFYVHPDRVASVGIFVPSWFDSPARTAYRYLQHYSLHPYLWQYLEGGTLRSWGAKSLLESGRQAFYQGKSGGSVCGAAPLQLDREGRPHCREVARWIPEGRSHRDDWHGISRSDRRQALGSRRPATHARPHAARFSVCWYVCRRFGSAAR
jgi:flavin-dependent dehydrogenase